MLASSSPAAEGAGERGRKREDILRGSTVIYEEAASNKRGGGGTPAPVKPGESEKIFRVRDAGLEEGRGGVGGKLLPDVQRCHRRSPSKTTSSGPPGCPVNSKDQLIWLQSVHAGFRPLHQYQLQTIDHTDGRPELVKTIVYLPSIIYLTPSPREHLDDVS